MVSGAEGTVQLWNSLVFFLSMGRPVRHGFRDFMPRACALELGLLVKLRVWRSAQKWAACVVSSETHRLEFVAVGICEVVGSE